MPSSMQVFTHIELFSQAQDEQVLSLLHFPQSPLLVPAQVTFKVKVRSQGRTSTFQSQSSSVVVQKLQTQNINQVTVQHRFEPSQEYGDNLIIHSSAAVLDIAPTNSLWCPTSSWTPKQSGPWSGEFSTTQAFEKRLQYYDVKHYPSIFTLGQEVAGSNCTESINDWLFVALAQSIPNQMSGLPIVGGGGAETFDMDERSYLVSVPRAENVLRGHPLYISRLGRSFGILQPVMFGPYDLCLRVAALAEGIQLREVAKQGTPTWAVLRVPQNIVEQQHLMLPELHSLSTQ